MQPFAFMKYFRCQLQICESIQNVSNSEPWWRMVHKQTIIITIVLENGSDSYIDTINSFFFLQKVLTSFTYLASQPTATRSSKIKRGQGAREMGCLPSGGIPTDENNSYPGAGGRRQGNSKSEPSVTCTWRFQLRADIHHLSLSQAGPVTPVHSKNHVTRITVSARVPKLLGNM